MEILLGLWLIEYLGGRSARRTRKEVERMREQNGRAGRECDEG
jgi:hypothetical protein